MFSISGLPRGALLVVTTSLAMAGMVTWIGFRAEGQSMQQDVPSSQVVAPVAETAVLVAASPIAQGVAITGDMLKSISLPSAMVGNTLMLDTETSRLQLLQVAAARDIPEDTPFVLSDIEGMYKAPEPSPAPVSRPRPAESLATGMRAISLPLTADISITGLIETDDRVDILVSYALPDAVRAVRTVLADVRVVAIDQGGAGNRMMTLELHPEGAKVLALAQRTGDLVFVLSPPGRSGSPRIVDDAPILSTQISGEIVAPPADIPYRQPVTVFRGTPAAAAMPTPAKPPSAETARAEADQPMR